VVRTQKVRWLAAVSCAVAVTLSSSCVTHRHVIGLGPTGMGEATERQYYILFGLVRFNEVDPRRMADNLTSYSIESEFSLVDLLLSPFLLPLTVTSRTVTVKT